MRNNHKNMGRSSPEFLPPDTIAAIQREAWPRQRRYVMENSPYFQELWRGHTVPEGLEDLAELPTCDKPTLRQNQADHPLYGNYLAADPATIIRLHRTSGTTGQAMNAGLTHADALQAAEVAGRAQSAAGLGPGHLVAHCLNYQMWMGGYTDHAGLEATGATAIPFGTGSTELLITTIRDLKITAISCTPSYPAALEQVIEERFPDLRPRDLGLKLGLFGGEAGLDNMSFRERLEETWGFRVRNSNYGMSDVLCNFASQCDFTHDLHFMALDVLYPEVINPETGEVLSWEAGSTGELVLTNLVKECQPLVRFRTGDIVTLNAIDTCECGRTAPRFRVTGRADDMVVIRGLNVFPVSVAAIANGFAELTGEYRIVLDGPGPYDRLPLEVELAEGQAPAPALADAIGEEIRRHIRVSATVTLALKGKLPRTLGNTGKTKRVIRQGDS